MGARIAGKESSAPKTFTRRSHFGTAMALRGRKSQGFKGAIIFSQ